MLHGNRQVRYTAVTTLAMLAAAGALRSASIAEATHRLVPCDLHLTFGRRTQNPPQQFHVPIVITNIDTLTKSRCKVSGYPEVELIGPPFPTFGTIYSIPPESLATRTVALRAGQSAHAVLTWLPSTDPPRHRWTPGYVRVVVNTNRGLSLPMALPWPYGSVLRQDAATHPGTYVGPVRAGRR